MIMSSMPRSASSLARGGFIKENVVNKLAYSYGLKLRRASAAAM